MTMADYSYKIQNTKGGGGGENGTGGYQNMDGVDSSDAGGRIPFGSRDNLDSNGDQKSNKRRDVIDLYCTQVNHDLLISKIFYFFFFSAFGSLFPLIAVYFKQLGMNATQAGILLGIRPFVEYASAPFWGSFADRFKKGKILLLASLFCWIAFTCSLAFVQPLPVFCIATNGTHNYLEQAYTGTGTAGLANTRNRRAVQFKSPRQETPPQPETPENQDESQVDSEYKPNPERAVFRVRHKPGIAPIHITEARALNYIPEYGDLVRPPFSTKVFRKSGVEEVFLLLLLLTVLGVFFSSPALSLADTCTLAALDDHPEFYGKQRMFGSLGWGLAMFFVGIALDYSNAGFSSHPCHLLDMGEKNYTLCFAIFSVLMACALISATQFRFSSSDERPDTVQQKIMDLQVANVEPSVAENVRARAPAPQEASVGPKMLSVLKTFSAPHYASFLFVTFCFGFGIGMVFGFLFWHLQDIGGTASLFGVASVVNHVSEIFAYFFSFRLINAVGHMRVLYIGLLVNCARFLYVSWLKDPWWVLPFEFVQGLTHAAVWATVTSYISLTAPEAYKSQAQSIVESLHMGIGRGIGTMVSGIIITYTGTEVVFRAYGIACLILAAGFYGINRYFKADGIKYQASDLLEDSSALAPHGAPMRVNYSPSSEQNLTQAAGQGYGATFDPTQEAYDRYVHEPYDKPVKFEPIQVGGGQQQPRR